MSRTIRLLFGLLLVAVALSFAALFWIRARCDENKARRLRRQSAALGLVAMAIWLLLAMLVSA